MEYRPYMSTEELILYAKSKGIVQIWEKENREYREGDPIRLNPRLSPKSIEAIEAIAINFQKNPEQLDSVPCDNGIKKIKVVVIED